MRIEPRSYQIECVSSIYQYFTHKYGNPVCALPTGTGKSVVIAMFLESIYYQFPSQKVIVLTHVKELIQQNYEKLLSLWPSAPAGINSSGLGRRDYHQKIIFGGIASVAKKWAQFGKVDLVIIDEAHLVSPSDSTMYQQFLKGLKTVNPNLKVIGFTATPWRIGQGRLTEEGGIFTDICFDITGVNAFNRLIAEGFLSTLVPKQTRQILDVDGLHVRAGDFVQSELVNAVDKAEITQRALEEALEIGSNRKHWLIFCSGVEHSEHVADMLTDMGVSCAAVHSEMSDAERDKAIADFKAGRIPAISNNNVLTTGFDMPGIDLILMLRPTMSPVLWVQMLGRGTRPCDGKENCLVLDFAGNTKRLGPINDPVLPRKKGEKGGEAPVRLCEACSTWNHASLRACFNCGVEFPPPKTKLKQNASTDAIIKGDNPIVEIFEVQHITYALHEKLGRPPSIRINYYCNLQKFNEFVCPEHTDYAGRVAREWWKKRTTAKMPTNTNEALEVISSLPAATHIRVWVNNGKYPKIMAHCFDGTGFGTKVNEVSSAPTTETVYATYGRNQTTKLDNDIKTDYPMDDDIPF